MGRIILGLTGPIAAGKGICAEYIIDKGFVFYSLSDILRHEAVINDIEPTRKNITIFANELREEEGPAVLAIKTIDRVKKDSHDKFIIDSIRSPAEVQEFKKINLILISVDAPPKLRYERIIKRNRQGDVKSFEEFLEAERRENIKKDNNQQILECMKLAEYTITNEGPVESVHSQIDEILKDIDSKKTDSTETQNTLNRF